MGASEGCCLVTYVMCVCVILYIPYIHTQPLDNSLINVEGQHLHKGSTHKA